MNINKIRGYNLIRFSGMRENILTFVMLLVAALSSLVFPLTG